MTGFLKVFGNQIVDHGQPVRLKGVNLGGWLMKEAYFMYAPNRAVHYFKEDFARRLGTEALVELEEQFHKNFIRASDFAMIAEMGCNCIRLPFHYGLIETSPYEYDLDGVAYLDRALRWAKANGLRVILDLHAAPGAQNHDWHSDSLGSAQMWSSEECQRRVCALWTFLADRYKNNTTVAGYDVLNEAVVADARLLNAFYARVIAAIRTVDQNHLLFIEGNHWAMDLDCLDAFDDDNWAYSIHFYHPIEFTFNFIPQLRYPLKSSAGVFNRTTLRKLIRRYQAFAKKRPVLVGEFGIHSRQGYYGDQQWLSDVLECFDAAGFHWTYWTYKAVKHHMFPDGIYSYFPNDPWVNRAGPLAGWETWGNLWPTMKSQMTRSWRTEQFDVNPSVCDVLKKYLF